MKKFQNLGNALSREQSKKITGGDECVDCGGGGAAYSSCSTSCANGTTISTSCAGSCKSVDGVKVYCQGSDGSQYYVVTC